ncbi:MAG: HIT domain-containing protein [Rhodospirillaceae bacterium]|jgi:diadenosine tetraphosphate (Ap4A) HIT family hydrolase|nr:HIT domain-containing protein [Rhodospirillaceae bacterium]
MIYDYNNVFAKILREEIPCKKVYEDDFVLAFYDIKPTKLVHVLIIPKGAYISFDDFSKTAPDTMIVGFIRAVGLVARQLEIAESGYRLLSNIGRDSGQEVTHFHVHLFGGNTLDRMV